MSSLAILTCQSECPGLSRYRNQIKLDATQRKRFPVHAQNAGKFMRAPILNAQRAITHELFASAGLVMTDLHLIKNHFAQHTGSALPASSPALYCNCQVFTLISLFISLFAELYGSVSAFHARDAKAKFMFAVFVFISLLRCARWLMMS